MDGSPLTPLRIGDWRVDPASGLLTRAGESIRVEARSLRLLLCLAARAGEVVSIDELLDQVWPGVIVTPDSVYQAVTSLRRLLGDDPKRPSYIATVPRLGYRMVAAVGPCAEPAALPVEQTPTDPGPGLPSTKASAPGLHRRWMPAVGVVLILVLAAISIAYLTLADRPGGAGQSSVAVLPFLDLTTQAMTEEYFADGMTEELIDHLSELRGFRVPSATSSFYFKDKSLPMARIAQKLDVAYLLDGSVRESGSTFRVAVRLIRADDGYVVWTESYDRPLGGDILAIQKDIAAAATQSVQASIKHAATTVPASAR